MLPGGIIGRTDDLLILRGVNVYPSAIEAIVRMFEVGEFRLVLTREGALDALTVEVEASDGVAESLSRAFRERLGVRIQAQVVPLESLPRWELKARRVVDAREG
jgi:phenylacetate-CoA ligase